MCSSDLSAFTVGLLHALYALKGEMVSKKRLAMEGIFLEQEVLKETVGSQDQALAAYGGFNHIAFLENGEISVRPMAIGQERMRELNSHLMLFYSGIKRTASSIAGTYVGEIDAKRRQMRIMKDLVEESISILNNGKDIATFGELLHEGWELKRSLSPRVSNPDVDEMYSAARAAGATGGKLIGAGGGGFILLFVHPSKQGAVKERLQKLIHVPFKFEFSGSQIIFFDQEEDYSAEEKARATQSVERFQELGDEAR